MKIITYKIGSKQNTVKLQDADADKVKSAMDAGVPTVTIAGTTIRTRDILGIQVVNENVSGEMNAQKVKVLRRALIDAANACRVCPRVVANGIQSGRGYVETEDGEMRQCQCQIETKRRFGVDPDDMSWAGRDE